jgi:hypothetical protein
MEGDAASEISCILNLPKAVANVHHNIYTKISFSPQCSSHFLCFAGNAISALTRNRKTTMQTPSGKKTLMVIDRSFRAILRILARPSFLKAYKKALKQSLLKTI